MPKKKVVEGKADVKILSLADLFALYQYVSAANGRLGFSAKAQVSSLIADRLAEVEAELQARAFGQNPYVITATKVTTIEGKKPEEVLAKLPAIKPTVVGDKTGATVLPPENMPTTPKTQPEAKPKKNFVVAKGDLQEENVVKATDPHFVVVKNEEE